jgi:hypothetical protein
MGQAVQSHEGLGPLGNQEPTVSLSARITTAGVLPDTAAIVSQYYDKVPPSKTGMCLEWKPQSNEETWYFLHL